MSKDLVTVCDQCGTEACWRGEYMCLNARKAGIKKVKKNKWWDFIYPSSDSENAVYRAGQAHALNKAAKHFSDLNFMGHLTTGTDDVAKTLRKLRDEVKK